ncbi:MAG TPA: hypothetical protein P5511_04880 [Candidatus Goldiibacteriota bacterium]|nr:hypothetical protein [Candidatus Goldiibacteriota bacterium]
MNRLFYAAFFASAAVFAAAILLLEGVSAGLPALLGLLIVFFLMAARSGGKGKN